MFHECNSAAETILNFQNSSLFNEFVCKLGFFSISGPVLKAHECQKEPNLLAHEPVEYNVFLFDEPRKGSKSLKIFKISLTFRFDKL
jgi:hypothetical protein